jgi:hypothetical protein
LAVGSRRDDVYGDGPASQVEVERTTGGVDEVTEGEAVAGGQVPLQLGR